MEIKKKFLQNISNQKTMIMKKQIIIILLFFGLATITVAQQVEVLDAGVINNDKIKVDYKISKLKSYQYIEEIEFYVSTDNGKTFTGPLKEVQNGKISKLRNGKHTMVWSVMKEMPMVEADLVFIVRIKVGKVKKAFMVSLVGNNITPFGLRVGQLGKIGWYVEGRASLLAANPPAYTYRDGKIIDYDQHGYYEFNGNKGYNAWSAVAGVSFQLSWNLFLNAGAGYGVENYMYEIDQYSYNPEEKTGNAWVKDDGYSNSGFELDAGLIFKYKMLIISAGATSVNFKTINWEAGIGIAF